MEQTSHRSRLVSRANQRLQLPVPEFALMPRRKAIDLVMADSDLVKYIDKASVEEAVPREELRKRARRMATKMGPRFSAVFYFRVGYFLARTMLRTHYRVRALSVDNDAMAAIAPDSTIILVSNHRSNFDPLVIAYLASQRSTVSLSAGEWARMWPFRYFVNAAGGFVLERSSDDPLYRQVLASYFRTSAANGMHHAIFPEGELTRSGRMNPPKLGILSFLCRACSNNRDIVFIPVGVNYDRVPEDRKLCNVDQRFDRRRSLFVFLSTLRYIGTVLSLVFRRSRPFGYACAAFGKPLSLTAWLNQRNVGVEELASAERYQWLPELTRELMGTCAGSICATPCVLVCTVMCNQDQSASWTRADIGDGVRRLADRLQEGNAIVFLPGGIDDAIDGALNILTRSKLIRRADGSRYTIVDSELPVLQYYARSIEHLMP